MKYRTIVADPPWEYHLWPTASTSAKSKFNRNGIPADCNVRAPLPYPAMSVADICALPVADMAEEDATLYLWTTNRYLRDSYDVSESWGFRFSQILTWCKPRRGIGPGGVFASTTEFVIVARRGRPRPLRRTDSTWYEWPRAAHSQKPEAFLDLVEQVSPGPYLELFARRQRLGWDTWGNECRCDVEMGRP
jgi:N6-adenosine-specific RNA methylase IME4